jgi:hypothetical protein
MAQVVGAELQLETVAGGLAVWWGHDTRIVDQNVDGVACAVEAVAEGGDRGEAAEVDLFEGHVCLGRRYPYVVERLGALAGIAADQDDAGAVLGEHPRGLVAEASSCPGDNGRLATKVGNIVFGIGHDMHPQ